MSDVRVPTSLSALGGWLDDRFHAARGTRNLMRKVFPDHWSFMLGEIALWSFVILLLTGTYLALFFVPSMSPVVYHGSYTKLDGITMSQAYQSTLDISFDAGVRDRTQVPELVGVAHRADRLNLPVEYVERHGKEHLVVPIAEDRSRLAVYLAGLDCHVDPDEPGGDRGKHPGHLLGADDAPGQRRDLAAAVSDQLNVSGEQLLQAVDVAFPERAEELRREFVSLLAVRLEPWPPRVHVVPRPHGELPARRLGPPDRRRDLREAEPEHFPQYEDRSLERGQPLEQQQGRCRHRVGQFRRALGSS